jgi:hypothetical protein
LICQCYSLLGGVSLIECRIKDARIAGQKLSTLTHFTRT